MPKREQPRIAIGPCCVEATIDKTETVAVKNISLGGAFLRLAKRRPIGTVVELRVQYGDYVVEAEGRITHFQSDGVGLAFRRLPSVTIDKIQELICALLTSGGKGSERRAYERSMPRVAVVWSGGSGFQHGEFADISPKGAFIRSPAQPAVGSVIDIYLAGFGYDPASEQPSELRGCLARVVNHRDGGFGIALMHPSAEFTMGLESLFSDETR